jgi:hypothetical protein
MDTSGFLKKIIIIFYIKTIETIFIWLEVKPKCIF